MKPNFKYFLIILFGSVICGNIDAQLCLFEGKLIEVEGQQSLNIFSQETDIFYDQELLIDSEVMSVSEVSEDSFTTKSELEEILSCKFYVGSDFNEDIEGVLLAFDLNNEVNQNGIHKLDYVRFQDFQRTFEFVLINKNYLFEFVNTQRYILREVSYFEAAEDFEQSYYVTSPDQISGSLTVTVPAEYETVTEQMLLHDGYDSISVNQVEFEAEHTTYYDEVSSCPEAEYTTIEDIILVKPAYQILNVIPPEFELVSEVIVVSFPYVGAHFYERELINHDTLQELYTSNIQLESVFNDCSFLNFLICADYDETIDSLSNFSGLGLAYPVCEEGYQSAGVYCYSDSINVPYQTAIRVRTILSAPAMVTATDVPAVYESVSLQRITNKDELTEDCIQLQYDSIATEKIDIPAYPTYHPIPTTYETIEKQLLVTPAEFIAEPSLQVVDSITLIKENSIERKDDFLKMPVFDVSCLHGLIKSKLVEEGLILPDVDVKSTDYYQGIISYQISNRLPIGVIDETLLNHLNIYVY